MQRVSLFNHRSYTNEQISRMFKITHLPHRKQNYHLRCLICICSVAQLLSIGLDAGGREFDSDRTNTQGFKITEEKVLPL